MAKCLFCERKSIFLRVNSDGYCKECVPRVAARQKEIEDRRKKEEELLSERRRLAEREAQVLAQRKAVENVRLLPATLNYDLVKKIHEEFFAFDVETTGLSASTDRIVEISAVRYVNGSAVDSFCELVNAGVMIPQIATEINHITNDMIATARSEADVFSSFINYLKPHTEKNVLFCSHNAQFDMTFLRVTLARLGIALSASYLDTLSLSRAHIKGVKNYKLGTIANQLGIHQNDAHRANSDAITCGEILLSLLPDIERPFLREQEEIEKNKAFDSIRQTLVISPVHSRIPVSDIKNAENFSKGYEAGAQHYFQGEIYYKSYKYEQALQHYDLARANGYCTPALYMSYCLVFRKLKDYENEIAISEEGLARLDGLKHQELLTRRNKAIELLIVSRERKEKEEMLLAEKEKKKRKTNDALPCSTKGRTGRRVRQLNDNGDIIGEYDSLTAASLSVGISIKSIRCAAIGEQKHAAGYRWEYIDE